MNSTELFILSGGAGTRLWPLSRETYPKQFYDLAGTGNPLLIDTANRLKGLGRISVVTTEALRFSSLGLLLRNGHSEAQVLGEPKARNTAAAVALATLQSLRRDPLSIVGVFPADHFIQQTERFRSLLKLAIESAQKYNEVVTLGITPEHPATGYGYMLLNEAIPNSAQEVVKALPVLSFVEKPSLEAAQKLLATQRSVWNAGMFIFPAQRMAEHFEKFMPDLWAKLSNLNADFSNLAEIYPTLESQSIDYGIMEKLNALYCVPGTGMGWSDVGSWEEVANTGKSLGRPLEVASKGNFYTGFGAYEKRVAFVGIEDTVVIDTPDALLIVKKGHGQEVREVVSQLKLDTQAHTLVKNHVFEERPWGRFEVLMDTENFKSKRITVWPAQQLSYQSHAKRSEHWVVVKGQAEVTLNDKVHILSPGQHIFIPTGSKHRMANKSSQPIEFIEVQTGSYFGEDDIVRYSDDYGRV